MLRTARTTKNVGLYSCTAWRTTAVHCGESRLPRRHRPDGLIVTANTQSIDEALRKWRRPAGRHMARVFRRKFDMTATGYRESLQR
jgi:hypothetical protein